MRRRGFKSRVKNISSNRLRLGSVSFYWTSHEATRLYVFSVCVEDILSSSVRKVQQSFPAIGPVDAVCLKSSVVEEDIETLYESTSMYPSQFSTLDRDDMLMDTRGSSLVRTTQEKMFRLGITEHCLLCDSPLRNDRQSDISKADQIEAIILV